MKSKTSPWGIVMAASAVIIVYTLYISYNLSPDSNLMFNYTTGLVIGISLMHTANTLRLREDIEKIKSKLGMQDIEK